MRIDLEFVELHSSLFIDGQNFMTKLYADKRNRAPIDALYYDTEGTGKYTKEEKVVVEFRGTVTVLDTVSSRTLLIRNKDLTTKPHAIVPIAGEDRIVRAQASGPGMGLKQTAQVSDPTREAPKTILRKAKFQGQESQGE